jgi:hypothetical protein
MLSVIMQCHMQCHDAMSLSVCRYAEFRVTAKHYLSVNYFLLVLWIYTIYKNDEEIYTEKVYSR